jgi:hypothetical protein
MRGRNSGGGNNNNNNNNNNRRGPNPLTRNYESNGPDVKIRGSAQQIAEKYAQLARDSHSSGDRVMAENYLQHAEHYNRIIAAAQAQMPIQNVQQQRDQSDDDDEDRDDFDTGNGGQQGNIQNNQGQNSGPQDGGSDDQQPQQFNAGSEAGSGPQPEIEGLPAEVALNPEAAGEGNGSARNRSFVANDGPDGEGRESGRRSRRPRRGERSRPDAGDTDEAVADGGLVATLSRGASVAAPQEQPVEPQVGGATALVDTDN